MKRYCFQLADYGTLKLPIEEFEQLQNDAPSVRYVTTDSEKLMQQYLYKQSENKPEGSPPRSTAEPGLLGREGWQSYFSGLFDRSHSAHRHHEHVKNEATDRRKHAPIADAKQFYLEKVMVLVRYN